MSYAQVTKNEAVVQRGGEENHEQHYKRMGSTTCWGCTIHMVSNFWSTDTCVEK